MTFAGIILTKNIISSNYVFQREKHYTYQYPKIDVHYNKNKDTKTQKKMDIRIYIKCFSLVTQRHTKI